MRRPLRKVSSRTIVAQGGIEEAEAAELRLYMADIEALDGSLGGRARLASLSLSALPNLRSARGLENLLALESLTLAALPALDLDDLFTRAARLPMLTSLFLAGDVVARLPPSFAGLQGLLEITLGNAAKIDLDAAFAHLAKLEGLRIVHLNGYYKEGSVALPPSIASLRQIRELRIDAPCGKIPDAITELVGLEKLAYLSNIRKRDLVKGIPASIGKMVALRALLLRGHAVKALPESFCELRELRELDLFGCPIERLPERFGELINLEDLDLSYCNQLGALPESFGSLAALRTLRAGSTKLTALPKSFGALRLTTCELPNELLAQVKLAPPDVLFVDELTIDRPYDTALPENLGDPIRLVVKAPSVSEQAVGFSKLTRLERLHMAPAPAFDLGDAFHRLSTAPNFRSLSLHGWKLTSLPKTIGELRSLTRLGLSDNSLETLPDEIGALTSLEELILDGNPLTHFPEVELPALRELSLADAPLEQLPRGIGRLTSLKKLGLWKSRVKSLPSELASLSNLQEINMQSSETVDFEVLGALPSLRSLDLTWVRSKIDPAALFRALARTKIQSLVLQYASLSGLPAEIGGLEHLRNLDVRSTDIRAFPPETASMRSLRLISFQDFRIPTAAIKPVLPKGRWRKQGSGRSCCYVRVDDE